MKSLVGLIVVGLFARALPAQPNVKHAIWAPAWGDGWEVADSVTVYDIGSVSQTSDRDVYTYVIRMRAPRPDYPCIFAKCDAATERAYWKAVAAPGRFLIGYEFINCHNNFMRSGDYWVVDSAWRVVKAIPASKRWSASGSIGDAMCRKILHS